MINFINYCILFSEYLSKKMYNNIKRNYKSMWK
ncbi:hypothetical protein TVCOMph1_CDS0031 [Terrisporobacter phage TVCOM_ph1]